MKLTSAPSSPAPASSRHPAGPAAGPPHSAPPLAEPAEETADRTRCPPEEGPVPALARVPERDWTTVRTRSGPSAGGRSRAGAHCGGARGPSCRCGRRNPHRTVRPSPVQDPSAETQLTRPQPPGTEQRDRWFEVDCVPELLERVERDDVAADVVPTACVTSKIPVTSTPKLDTPYNFPFYTRLLV